MNGIDPSPWLEVPRHTELIKALVRGDTEAYISPLYLPYISPVSPLYLPYIRCGLAPDKIISYISLYLPISHLYLPYIRCGLAPDKSTLTVPRNLGHFEVRGRGKG